MQDIKTRIKLTPFSHTVRASQAVLQYGVGAMVDFPEQTLMTAAPETWEASVVEIHDERLEDSLRVDFFGMPGSKDESKYQGGVSYTRFPEWYFCPRCRVFQPMKEWVKEYRKSPKMKKSVEKDENMVKRIRCSNCNQDLVVARIVTVCGHGHIDDFPWVKWVHAKNIGGNKSICKDTPKLKFMTSASSTEGLEGLTVSCECGARATLKGAFDKGALDRLDKKLGFTYGFQCTGRHPWKNVIEPCGEYPHVLQRGSSSVYFPISESSLVIPPYSSLLTERVENSKADSDLRKAIKTALDVAREMTGGLLSEEQRATILKARIDEYADKIAKEIGVPQKQVRTVLERRWNKSVTQETTYSTRSVKYRAEEYEALNGEVVLDDNTGEFVREETEIKDYNLPFIKSISLIHKIREVQVLTGFSRLEPVDSDNSEKPGKILPVSIKEDKTNWYPGYEVRGEGIFIEFDEDAISVWRSGNTRLQRRLDQINQNYSQSYYGERRPREITAKFLLLHTISHLLMKQLSFECGYSIASIKERIFCSEPAEGKTMSGILIYTAGGDSEGTMGGLVRQGRSDTFPMIYRKAIESAMRCSNDPVCSLSMGQGRDSLNLSACHSCTLVPETSCEEFNVFLDRGVVIGTFEDSDIGFYSEYVKGRKITNLKPQKHKVGKKKSSGVEIIIKDKGVDLRSMTYVEIWKNILQFSESEEEKRVIEDMINNAEEYSNIEKPYQGATINVMGNTESIDVNLIWPVSRVMLFTSENEEEYEAARKSDWTCFCLNSQSFEWRDLILSVKES